jgi:hypothetical protein
LLLMWGGEVINFTRAGQNLEDVVRRIGHPSMVSVALRLDRARDCSYFPSLMGLFLGRPSERGGTVYVPAPGVAAHEVIDVWYPGHPEYDKYPRLPRDRPVEAAC